MNKSCSVIYCALLLEFRSCCGCCSTPKKAAAATAAKIRSAAVSPKFF